MIFKSHFKISGKPQSPSSTAVGKDILKWRREETSATQNLLNREKFSFQSAQFLSWADQSAAKAQRRKSLQNENKQRIKQDEAAPGCSAICSVHKIPDMDKPLAENKLLCQVLLL